MTSTTLWQAATAVLVLVVAGCGTLEVSDPTAIEENDLNNANGAELLRIDALSQLYGAVAEGAHTSALLADEFLTDPDLYFLEQGITSDDEALDRRESERYEQVLVGNGGGVYYTWQQVRLAATAALPKLRAYAPAGAAQAHIGEMFAVRGFVALRLAEDFCAGFPLRDVLGYKPAFGPPLSTDEAFERALVDFDSALVQAADSARILNFARVGRARALLGLGHFADATATAALVPTDYVVNAEYGGPNYRTQNHLVLPYAFGYITSVANQEGGIGLDFVAAGDPRVQTTQVGTANDGVTPLYAAAKYPDANAPIVLASGVEARLIEAEAALNAGDGAWLTILNALRTTQIDPPLPELSDPGTPATRVDLLFRERAFWLFATGHRLADLRRLIRHYGRSSESVFPTGAYRVGGGYGTATSIPFPARLETPFNPAVTGCTSR